MNTYGEKVKITIYGASHEAMMGVVIDGIPPGLKIDYDNIDANLKRRRPGKKGTTKRVEKDCYKITNGIFNEYTTGAPLNIIIENKDINSKDYSNLKYHYRPNHADYTSSIKYKGYNDYRGGGIFSGRLTALIVIAGSIISQIVPFKVNSEIIKIGELNNLDNIDSYLEKIEKENDSVGGIIRLTVSNVKPGLGNPFFGKTDAKLSHAVMSIPGVKALSFGTDLSFNLKGSKYNDTIIDSNGKTRTNNSGGIVGGITNGNDIVLNVYVKPTASISKPQETYNFKTNKIETLKIEGRHDVAFVRRIPVVLESIITISLADIYFSN